MSNTATIRSTSDPTIKLGYPRDTLTIDVDGYPGWSLQGTTTYDLGTFTLNSTGASTTVSATDTLSVANCGVTLSSSWAQPLGIAVNGLQLKIPTNNWTTYNNLQNTQSNIGVDLQGLVTTQEINTSNAIDITFAFTTTVYMIRQTNWNAVSTTGWTSIGNAGNILQDSSSDEAVYERTFTAGTYTFDNNSAMYMFDPDRATTVPAAGLFASVVPFANTDISPPSSFTAPDFKINKRIQLKADRTQSLSSLQEFRKSIRANNNLVPYNQEQLQKEDGTIKEYNIARAIASNVAGSGGGGGGGGVTETEYWF